MLVRNSKFMMWRNTWTRKWLEQKPIRRGHVNQSRSDTYLLILVATQMTSGNWNYAHWSLKHFPGFSNEEVMIEAVIK